MTGASGDWVRARIRFTIRIGFRKTAVTNDRAHCSVSPFAIVVARPFKAVESFKIEVIADLCGEGLLLSPGAKLFAGKFGLSLQPAHNIVIVPGAYLMLLGSPAHGRRRATVQWRNSIRNSFFGTR